MKTLSYFKNSFIVAAFGLVLSYFIGHSLTAVFITALLAVLELSISVDNAVVNVTVLKQMDAKWQHRFITWGMLVAVFGMRLIFPLAIVAIAMGASPWSALQLALFNPQEYSRVMLSVHAEVAAFGGSFLALVALSYFFDHEKEVHWITSLEKPLSKLGKLGSIEVGAVLIALVTLSQLLPHHSESVSFLIAGIFGVITFILVDAIEALFKVPTKSVGAAGTGLGYFIYLEVLDASFSFDGVIGAFAITNNLLIIAIGLGIGAMFVRSLTLYMLKEGTLETYQYLEHGAFYAVAALATVMLLDPFLHIPEAATGLIGGVIIALSIVASIRERSVR